MHCRAFCFVVLSCFFASAAVAKSAPTELQDHVAFFKGKNGKISYLSTYRGLRRLGANPLYAAANAFFGLGARTTGSRLFSTEVDLNRVHQGVYRGDDGETHIFNQRGKYDEARFEEIWKKYDSGEKGYFTK